MTFGIFSRRKQELAKRDRFLPTASVNPSSRANKNKTKTHPIGNITLSKNAKISFNYPAVISTGSEITFRKRLTAKGDPKRHMVLHRALMI